MRIMTRFLLGASVFLLVACLDMDVTNPNNPSRESAIQSPEDVETLIATSFLQWFNRTQSTTPSVALTTMAGEFSSGFGDFGALEYSSEPRGPMTVDPTAGSQPHRAPWSDYYSVIAGNSTALRAIEESGLVIQEGGEDVTDRARAFAKFTQGLSTGYIGLMYDRGYIYDETIDPEELGFIGEDQSVQALIEPYPQVIDAAIEQLEAAQAIAEANNVEIPQASTERWISGYDLSTDEFVRLINTYIARLMVYQARTPDERAAVDWQTVINYIDAGITSDFAPVGEPGVTFGGTYKQRAARLRSVIPSDFMRPDYELIGFADQGGQFQDWWNSDWSDREPFTMENVQDRRIVGGPIPDVDPDAPEKFEPGEYMGHWEANIFAAERGTAHRSYYYYHRFGTGNTYNTGPLVIITTDEMNLLKAEGLIRLGRADEAVPLINQTRVANGELEPVTLDGVPETGGFCTPRRYDGSCGSLWDALRWEKRIEGAGVEAGVAFYDQRGWGGLPENTPLHFPIPAQDQDLLGLGRYTVGGGNDGSAAAPNPEQCPAGVTLPRCP